jgi:hypothetical protein
MYDSTNPVMIGIQRFLDKVHRVAFNGEKVEPSEVISVLLKSMDEIHRLENEIYKLSMDLYRMSGR